MTWQPARLFANRGGLGDKSRSFCLRSTVGWFFSTQVHCLLVWSALVLLSDCQQVFRASIHDDDSRHWLTHPRAQELCAHSFRGLEGTPVKGFTLDRAFVVTTPGLVFRQNIDALLNQGGHSKTHCHFHKYAKLHSSNIIKSYSEVLWMKDNAGVKFKQGSDFKGFKHVPLSFRCKDDMLTPHGLTQSVELGEYLSKSYFKTLKTLSPTVSSPKGLAFTTGDENLYQSVHAVLYGLLTEKQFVNAEVEKLSYHLTDDPRSRIETQDHLNHYVQESFKNEHHLFKDMSSPTGDRFSIDAEFSRELSAKDILSSLSLKECGKVVKGASHISDDLIESILAVSDAQNKYLLNSSIFHNYSKSISLPFRKFLNSWISSLHSNDNDLKLVSVNEMFMLSLLSVLGGDSSVAHIPPVSRLVIERFHFKNSRPPVQAKSNLKARPTLLPSSSIFATYTTHEPSHPKVNQESDHRESSGGYIDERQVYFRVLYNGKVITHSLSRCQEDPFQSLGLCRMPSFVVSLMNDEALQVRDEL